MMPKPAKDPEYLSTLERGLSVLRAFDDQHPEMRLSEVAAVTGLSPAVARRCLNTLVALGYVAQQFSAEA
jgi:IclR family transcriptional regulator, pca regulon regulatory protein